MDVQQMVRAHLESGADVTVAALPVPIDSARNLGVMSCDADGRIRGFAEKPTSPDPIPGDPQRAFASMGNYLFRPRVLREALEAAAERGEHDFGRHVLPRLVETHRVFAYDFRGNVLPEEATDGGEPYWRDVGTVDSYAQAHWDVLGPEPRLYLDDPAWPIRGGGMRGVMRLPEHSIVAPDARVQGARLRHCIVYSGACVGEKADLARCILMPGAVVGGGVILRDAIVGTGSVITAGRDFARPRTGHPTPWVRSPGGILVMPPRQMAGVQSEAVH
jgi:glucose-1-phosphate adenylyltransferase